MPERARTCHLNLPAPEMTPDVARWIGEALRHHSGEVLALVHHTGAGASWWQSRAARRGGLPSAWPPPGLRLAQVACPVHHDPAEPQDAKIGRPRSHVGPDHAAVLARGSMGGRQVAAAPFNIEFAAMIDVAVRCARANGWRRGAAMLIDDAHPDRACRGKEAAARRSRRSSRAGPSGSGSSSDNGHRQPEPTRPRRARPEQTSGQPWPEQCAPSAAHPRPGSVRGSGARIHSRDRTMPVRRRRSCR